MLASMNPCTEIRGDEKVRLRPDDQHGQHGEDDEGGDGEGKGEGLGHSPVRLLLNAWLVP